MRCGLAGILAVAGFLLASLGASPARAVPLAQIVRNAPEGVEPAGIETREYRIVGARVPGRISARQNVTVWQISAGSWNGQCLDGLSFVLVQTLSEDGRTPRQTNCYVSSEATLAQREALVGAFLAAQPGAVSGNELLSLRVEPAVITLEQDGQTIVVHLGLVA